MTHTHIALSRGFPRRIFAELWEYRELLGILVWRDLKVRYKQTALGAAWAVLQPLLTMAVFAVFFGRLARMPSDGLPYPLFAFCGLLPWQLFAYALNESGNSLVANRGLITKVYFPRLVMPLAAVIAGLVDFAIAFAVLILLILGYRVTDPSLPLCSSVPLWLFRLSVLPLLVILAVATALSVGLWLSALNVEYRDVRYTIPFLTQFWLFLTPIAYPASLVPPVFRPLYGLNPMAGVVEGFRWALLGGPAPGTMLAVSVAMVVVLFAGGLLYFRRMERTFADVV